MPPTNTFARQATEISFLGLQSYTEAQSNVFFGRDAEADMLASLVELNTLTIVFGRSGTGKTSLLNAGVFPKLRKTFCLPFRIRLEFNDNSPDLITQIKKTLKEEIDKYGFKVDSYPSSETLWEYFHKEPLWKTVTPILVFDQFEEIFTLARSNPRFASVELPVFWEELSDLIENTIPEKLKEKFLNQKEKVEYSYKRQKTKIVFSFREEYLPEFESITAKIPSLKYSRFRLLPMNGNQAYEVITKTWKQTIDPSEAKHLVSYFTNETGVNDYSLITVEPSLLSQVCAYIDKERIESGGGKVSAELLNKYPKETILRTIYEVAVTAANDRLSTSTAYEKNRAANIVKIFLEEKLITSEGFRNKYNLGGDDETYRPAINELTGRYFLREDDNAVELTHDVVAPIIKSDREKRRKDTAFAKLRKRVAVIAALLVLLGLGALAFFTNESSKAIKAQVKAEIAADSAEAKKNTYDSLLLFKVDSLETAVVNRWKNKDSSAAIIARLKAEIKRLETGKTPVDTSGIFSDSTTAARIRDLQLQVDLLEQAAATTSLDIAEKDARLSATDIEKAKLTRNLDIAIENAGAVQGELASAKKQLGDLSTANSELSNRKSELEERIKKLEDELALNIRLIAGLRQQVEAAKQNAAASQHAPSVNPGNLRIQVYDKSGEFKTPITKDTFLVYIIPDKGTNKDLLEKNKNTLLTKDCNGFNNLLPQLSGWQQAYFKGGHYYFHDVIQNGKYKIKICNILDGYFKLSMPSQSGNVFWMQSEDQKIAIKLGKF